MNTSILKSIIFLVFSLTTYCRHKENQNIKNAFFADENKLKDSTRELSLADSLLLIPRITLLDTTIQKMRLKIDLLYAKQLVLEAIDREKQNFDTVSYPFFWSYRDGLILYNDKNKFSCSNFYWNTKGKYGIFGIQMGPRSNIGIYSLSFNSKNHLIFGDNISNVNSYYGFVDIEQSKLFLQSGNPQKFFLKKTDSGYMESYYRSFFQYNISNKGFKLEKTTFITEACIGNDSYYSVDEDVHKTVDFYLQAKKIRKNCLNPLLVQPELESQIKKK